MANTMLNELRDGITNMSARVVYAEDAPTLGRQAIDLVPNQVLPLSKRERQVLSLVAEGCSNKFIAAGLGISERTVKSHLTNIMTKLGVSGRTHAVVSAIRRGWLSI